MDNDKFLNVDAKKGINDRRRRVVKYDGLASSSEVTDHGLEAFGCREIGIRDVSTVKHNWKGGLAFTDAGLVDFLSHIRHRRKDQRSVQGDK